MEKIAALILAAGLGKRLGTGTPKVLAQTSEGTLLSHVFHTIQQLTLDSIVVISGFQREKVEHAATSYTNKNVLPRLHFAFQEQQRGTGDAVRSAKSIFENFTGTILILYGDMPLISSSSLQALLDIHAKEKATLSCITVHSSKLASYGRIIRDPNGLVIKIKEAKDCDSREFQIQEVNAGIYAVDSAFLFSAVDSLKNNNAQGEYYLTDIVEKAATEGQHIATHTLSDINEVVGVNDLVDLSNVNVILRERIIEKFIRAGVTIADRNSVFIEPSVTIAPGAHIGPQVQLLGKTTIASGVTIEGCAYIKDCSIASNSIIKYGVRMEGSEIGTDCSVGPFAHIRPETKLNDEVKIGNFVETKKTILSKGAKASHLTYLGDCAVGEESNIGAGTITCNYDGYRKHQTTIGKNVFIGSNTSLVAPVVVEDGAIVGAGSTITSNVPADSLAVSRARQENKPGWAARKRAVMSKK